MYYIKLNFYFVRTALKSSHINGLSLGITTSILYYALAAAYILGAYLIQNNLFEMDLERIFLVFECIMTGAESVGKFNRIKKLLKITSIILSIG